MSLMTTCLCVLAEKKLTTLSELVNAEHDGVRYVGYRAGDSDEQQLAECDVAIHKGAYDAAVMAEDIEAARRWKVLQHLSARSALLEPLERVAVFADRGAMCQALSQLAPLVQQPRFALLCQGPATAACAAARGLAYPLVCKPVAACGPSGHRLAVVMREQGLQELCEGQHRAVLALPMVVQEFVPHAGLVIKGYGVGTLRHTRLKPSIPHFEARADGPAIMFFDSQKPLDAVASQSFGGSGGDSCGGGDGGDGGDGGGDDGSGCGDCGGGAVVTATAAAAAAAATTAATAASTATAATDEAALLARSAEVHAIVTAISAHMGVALVGVDVLVAPDGRCLVVDINHLSGAPHSVPGFTSALTELVKQRVVSRRAAAAQIPAPAPPEVLQT